MSADKFDGTTAKSVQTLFTGPVPEETLRHPGWLILLTCLLPGYTVHAGPDEQFRRYLSLPLEQLMDQKVTISTNSALPISKAPAVVTVLTKDDIEATGITNLPELLQGVPGIHVKYQHFGNRPLISFRGANNKQTLMLLNGAPMSDLMWRLGIFWKGLPTSMIDRVEIIRGPGSALFGTDASAGVINVITKTAGKIENTLVGLRAGSDDTQTAWMQYGGEWNGFDLGMTVDLFRTDGYDPLIEADAQTISDLRYGSNASLAPGRVDYGWKNADVRMSVARDHWRLMADYMRHDDLKTGMTGAGALDPVTTANDTRFDIGLFYDNQQYGHDWGLNAELRYRDIDYSSGPGFQEWPPGHTDAQGVYPNGVLNQMSSAERSVIGEVTGRYRGIEGHAITVGTGFRWQDIYRVEQWVNSGVDGNGNPLPPGGPLVEISDSPYAFAPEKDRTDYYLYAQDVWSITDAWELTFGARFDHDTAFGETLNPRVALVWQANEKLTTKVLYGRAYRAPYFQELYTETSFSLPNSDLDPEHSETWELAFSYAANSRLRLGLALYHFDQRDVISLQPVAGQTKYQYQNAGEQTIRGFELEAMWQPLHNLRVSANYAYNDPDDSQFREFGSPKNQAYARADWQFLPNWNWDLTGNWIGKRERSQGDSRASLDAYLVADTTLRYLGVKNWEFALSVRNVFDEDARDYTSSRIENDFPLPGRSFYVEARYDLDDLLK